MSQRSVVVLGSINTDLVIRGPQLPQPGETVLGGEYFQAAGGKGANQAVAAARAACHPVTFLGGVGDDVFGQQALRAFADAHLMCRHVEVFPDISTGVALIMVDHQGENCISVASGANARITPSWIQNLPLELFRGPGVFLTCLETPLDAVQAALRRAVDGGMTTILNPAPARQEVDCELLSLCDVVTPNEKEALMLAGLDPSDDAATADAAAYRLREMGARSIIVTAGDQGAWLLDDEQLQHMPAWDVQALDTTAAGDAFNGVLAVALAEGQSLADAARWAMAAAALSVMRRGAQPSLPMRAEIKSAIQAGGRIEFRPPVS